LEIIAEHPFTLSISGHNHYQKHVFFDLSSGGEHHHFNVGTASGSWYRGSPDEVGIPHTMMRDGTPNGYAIISFDGVGYSIRFKASRWPADYQMNIYAPDQVTSDALANGVEVLVNVFAGSEKSAVEMRVGRNAPWLTMQRVQREDPFYVELRQRETIYPSKSRRRLPKPSESMHIWSALLPYQLQHGTHLIEVRTTDMWGRQFQSRRPLYVE
jgi:hypothetical protein